MAAPSYEDIGIVPRGLTYIMDLAQKQIEEDGKQKYTVYMSFIQIYNEKVYDCLQDSEHILPLRVRESKYIGKIIKN